MQDTILKIARRLQAISQAGIHYAENEFDRERYEEIRRLSVSLASEMSDLPVSKISELFTNETGFQTPKVDIRAVVVDNDRILLTREKADGRWSLPGGFADINISPRRNAEKEVIEETGLTVQATRLLALVDTDYHNFPPLEYHYYKIVVLCNYISGELKGSNETYESAYFAFDDLPDLSLKRNTPEFINLIRKTLSEGITYLD